jgi:hypothetical protein
MYTDREKDELRVKAKEYVRELRAEFEKVKQGDRADARKNRTTDKEA